MEEKRDNFYQNNFSRNDNSNYNYANSQNSSGSKINKKIIISVIILLIAAFGALAFTFWPDGDNDGDGDDNLTFDCYKNCIQDQDRTEKGCRKLCGEDNISQTNNSINNNSNNLSNNTKYVKILPANKGIYMATPKLGDAAEIEQATGAKILFIWADAGDSSEGNNLIFNLQGHENLDSSGYISAFIIDIGLNPEGYSESPGDFVPQDILDGKLDGALKQIAGGIKSFGKPIVWQYPKNPDVGMGSGGYGNDGKSGARFNDKEDNKCSLSREIDCMNDAWNFNQYKSKYGASCDNSGEILCLDGAERYKDMVRYIHDFMEREGTGKYVTWMMGDMWPSNSFLSLGGDAYKAIYPGDEYVDYHSMMLYANGENGIHFWSSYGDSGCSVAVQNGKSLDVCSWTDKWEEVIEPFWSQAMSVSSSKPVFITEGSVESITRNPGFYKNNKYLPAAYEKKDKSAWFNDFFSEIKTQKYKGLAGWNYWQWIGAWNLGETNMNNQIKIDSGALVPGDSSEDDWKLETLSNKEYWQDYARCGIFDFNDNLIQEIKCLDFEEAMLA